jgi:hypothetical protein
MNAAPILHCFGNLAGTDRICASQVGNAARYAQDAMVGAGG